MIVPNFILWMSPYAREKPGQIIFSPGRYVTQRYESQYGLQHHSLVASADFAFANVSQGRPIYREYKNRRGNGLQNNPLVTYLMELLPGELSIEESPDHEDDQLVFTDRAWTLMRMICEPV